MKTRILISGILYICLSVIICIPANASEDYNFSLNYKSGYIAHVKVTDNRINISVIDAKNNIRRSSSGIPKGDNLIKLAPTWCGDKLLFSVTHDYKTSYLYIYDLKTNDIKHFYTFNNAGEDVVPLPSAADIFTSWYSGFYSNYGLFILKLSSGKPWHISENPNSLPFWSYSGKRLYYSEKTEEGLVWIMYFDSDKMKARKIIELDNNPSGTELYISPDEKNLLIKCVGADNNRILLLDLQRKTIRKIKVLKNINKIHVINYPWSRDSESFILRIYDDNSDKFTLAIFNINSQKIIKKIKLNDDVARVMGWDLSTNTIIIIKEDKSIWRLFPYTAKQEQIFPILK